MKHGLMILTLCVTLLSSANAMTFTDVTSPDFQGSEYSVVAWGDVDGNGYADLFLGSATTAGGSRLFLNNGSAWNNASEEYEVSSINSVKSARFVDFDQDGNLDLFCLTQDGAGVELYRLSENGRFQPVDLNLDGTTDGSIRSAVWCDADNDGSLDLLLSNRSSEDDESVLLIPSTDEFVEARGTTGPFSETLANQVSSVDFDQDGDVDYFISKEDGTTSLWKNTGGFFQDLGSTMEFPIKIALRSVTWADFNLDGNLDFYACGSSSNRCLFYQYPAIDGTSSRFVDVTDEFDLSDVTRGTTSSHAVDANGDGQMDIFLVGDAGNSLLINDGESGWSTADIESNLRQTNRGTRSCAWGDFDNDGDLDVAMAQGRNGIKLYRNESTIEHEYIGLKLCGSDNCMTPVLNCLVSVEFPDGKQWAATSMYASNIGSDLSMRLLYNPTLSHSEEWTVNVAWPNGTVTTLTQLDIPLDGVTELHMPHVPTPGNHQLVLNPVLNAEVSNYPNPFNPTTNIEFTLSEAANITLSIYNLLGQEVVTLASGTYEAGLHSLVFDAAALPSGLYMARLESPTGSVVHRMLLTK